MSTLESQMEDLLIRQLTCDVSQWTYRGDIRCEEDLWKNLRAKLNKNNIDKLQGVLLTDVEMKRIKSFLCEQAITTYKAARWLAGENGMAQIPLEREDAKLGRVNLLAVNNREVTGGNSSYEVIHQYRSPKDQTSERDRRFDVTLLINGLPMIAIELKNADHPYMDAFRQLQQYGKEGKFQGIMGFVQMFVVTNGVGTRYIAADNHGNLNAKFLTRWVNEKNEAVDDYLAFAKAALNIPMAHRMLGKYSVLDNESKKLILLRPYQIHAIEEIRKASRERRSGYIWHTTGSGKTLTSYTVTKNLLDIPSVDKTIFLIDRKDLDQQTTAAFLSYADSDGIDVENTDDTRALEEKLKSKDRCAIVTTIQKLQIIIRRYTEEETKEKYKKISQRIQTKSIAFIVDECHRAVTPETKRQIERFFDRSLWYGFTGTPIFADNMRARKGDLARTTDDLYGKPCLHKYTIKEAIADNAVLGFQIQSMGFSQKKFAKMAVDMHLFSEEDMKEKESEDIEAAVVRHFLSPNGEGLYDNDEHRHAVIDYIVNKSAAKFKLSSPAGEAYEGILTVPSIKVAQRYYKLFKEFVKAGKVEEDIRKLLPDFPKIAITYTVGVNQDGAMADQDEMKESLADYNEMFGTNWGLDTLGAYNAELNDRLARKKSRYRSREAQLDLVIVVDRLLTGFDAPCLSTIFLDRSPMKPQHLIQAFSRTNRLYDKTKRYGQIVTMQTPALYERCINEALLLYSNGSVADVAAPSWKQTMQRCKKAVAELRKIAPTLDSVVKLIESGSREEQMAFVKAFQAVDRSLGEAQVYDEFSESDLETKFDISRKELEALTAHYHNAVERLKEYPSEDGVAKDFVDVEYELESVKQIEVNFRYLVELIQAHMPEAGDAAQDVSETEDARICRYIEEYAKSNPKIGNVLRDIWFEVKMNPEKFREQDAMTIISQRIHEVIEEEIRAFSDKWCANYRELKAYASKVSESEISPGSVSSDMGDFRAYKAAGGTKPKVTYLRSFKEAVADFVRFELKPLQRF